MSDHERLLQAITEVLDSAWGRKCDELWMKADHEDLQSLRNVPFFPKLLKRRSGKTTAIASMPAVLMALGIEIPVNYDTIEEVTAAR